jgi:gamma-glutamyltranspeptidase/glutathione hydrolase
MSPSLLVKDDRIRLVIGSGGSKRIRTSVSQVLSQIVDFDRPLKTAVEAPRLFWDGEVLQVEPGFSREALEEVRRHVKINLWESKDVFFGGVHSVIPGLCGAGDSRRGGSVEEI